MAHAAAASQAGGSALRFDARLPVSVSLLFFATAPLAVLGAGVLLLASGATALSSHWAPRTLALTHLGTLGFLTMVLLGFLYPWIPAETGGRGRHPRTARVTHVLLLIGITGLVVGLLAQSRRLLFAALALLIIAMLLFLVPMGAALFRAPTPSPALSGLRVALASLFTVVLLGLWMAHGTVGVPIPGPRELWIQVHLSVGFLGWIGSLVAVTAWPVEDFAGAAARRRATLRWISAGVSLAVLVLVLDWFGAFVARPSLARGLAAAGALPAAVVVWLHGPVRALRSRIGACEPFDGGFRRVGAALAFATAGVAGLAVCKPDARWTLLFGWLAVWGWAGMSVHGLLLQRLPDLLAPSGRVGALPENWLRLACGLHAASVGLGVVAILATDDSLARLTGGILVAVGLGLGVCLRRLLSGAAMRPR